MHEPEMSMGSHSLIKATLPLDSKSHIKARTEKPDNYIPRFYVPDDKVSWAVDFIDYAPGEYTAPIVFKKDRSKDPGNPLLWADPVDPREVGSSFQSFEGVVQIEPSTGRPINPLGRTGITGRGELGKWGANFAGDPVITRVDPESGLLQMIIIRRMDCGELAIPGGMVDGADANIFATLSRELGEETSAVIDMSNAKIISRGYVDDRRNTDNAWMESTVGHIHLTPEEAANVELEAKDDAASVQWVTLTKDVISSMYASHPKIVLETLRQLRYSDEFATLPKASREQILGIVDPE